jgi:hypothetical protein
MSARKIHALPWSSSLAGDIGSSTFEPILRAGATVEIDTRASLDKVADALEGIADAVATR